MYTGPYTSRAAEKTLWKEEFTSPAKVHANGGVITGGAVPNRGIPLDGSTQYSTHAIGATDLTRDEINIEVRFSPNFAYTEDANRSFFDTTNGHRYFVYKGNNATGNALIIYLGQTLVANISSAAYGPYWNIGERNRLIVSSNGVSTDAWLNAVQILTAAGAAWTPKYPTELSIGATVAGASWFDGTIYKVKFNEGLLTQLDVDAIESDSLYTYMNRANAYFDMSEQTERAGTILGTTELLTDGDMEAPTPAAYTLGNAAVLTKEAGSPGGVGTQVLRVAHGGLNNPYAFQAILVVGNVYRARGWARGDGTVIPRIEHAAIVWTGTSSTSWQYFDVTFTSTGVSILLRGNTVVAGYAEFDDVEVFETDELLSDGDMEETGVGAWAVGSGAPLSKEGDSYEGLQCLRITKDAATQDWTSQNVTDINRLYHVTGVARGDGTIAPAVGNSTTYQWTGTTSTAWQPFDFWWIDPTGSGLYLYASAGGGAGNFVEFDVVSVRPILAQTLDKSPNGHVCLLGDGSTPATIPSFENPGFDLDGATDYLSLPNPAGDIFNSAGLSIAFKIRPDFASDDSVTHTLVDSSAGRYLIRKSAANALEILLGGSPIVVIPNATFKQYWITGGVNVLIIVSTTGNTDCELNGHQILTADISAWSPVDAGTVYLGTVKTTNGDWLDGEYLGCMAWPFRLSPIQRRDLTLSLGVNV